MSTIRPFRRSDREQLTALVNAHVAAVIPGVTVSVNALLNQLEREPGEAIVDPWVTERRTLVAVERDAIVGGAHLLRYGDDERVSESYRNLAEIRWLVCRPDAGATLMAESLHALRDWQPSRIAADGSLPAFGVYGVPATWPHIRELYVGAGFVQRGKTEILSWVELGRLPAATAPAGLTLARSVGAQGTRFTAVAASGPIGMIEVEANAGGLLFAQPSRWADIGNLCVDEGYRRRGVASWLLAEAAAWLRLGGATHLLAYAWPEQVDELGFYKARGFEELVRTERGWVLGSDSARSAVSDPAVSREPDPGAKPRSQPTRSARAGDP
jgi:GNAT superfamily N-acetyltransferase